MPPATPPPAPTNRPGMPAISAGQRRRLRFLMVAVFHILAGVGFALAWSNGATGLMLGGSGQAALYVLVASTLMLDDRAWVGLPRDLRIVATFGLPLVVAALAVRHGIDHGWAGLSGGLVLLSLVVLAGVAVRAAYWLSVHPFVRYNRDWL